MPTRKWGSEKLVNTSTTGNQVSSDIAVLADGTFIIVWQDDVSNDAVIRGQRFDAAGNKIGGEIPISAAGPFDGGDQTAPSVTALADGGFYVSWSDFDSASDHDIVGAVFNSNGIVQRFQISDTTLSDVADVQVTQIRDSSVSVWTNLSGVGGGDISFRIFDAAGAPGSVLTANTISGGSERSPAVSASPDGTKFAIVWQEGSSGILGRVFTAAGAQSAAEFVIASANGVVTFAVSDPVVAWLNGGNFAIAWRDNNSGSSSGNEIRVKIFDGQSSTAVALTGNILVNSTIFGSQENPTITVLPNGGFVIAWQGLSGVGGDSSSAAVRLQAFDGAGDKIGGEMLVNTTTTDGQFNPSITALADGRVAVSWTDNSSGNNDIRMQIVDPRDGIVNGTPASETLYGHDLVNDEISGFAGNDLLVGMKGDDGLYGGEGIDTLRGGFGADTLDGGSGSDIADYSDSTAAVNVNLVTGVGAGGFAVGDTYISIENVAGSAFADTLVGNAAANSINGGAGADLMRGLAGSDAYTVDNAGDVVDESAAGSNGADLIGSSISFSLADPVHAKGTIEHLILTGVAAINAIGNAVANTLTGNDAGNFLVGREGSDTLTGNGGNDHFLFDSALGASNVDTIRDFDVDGAGADSFDTIRLENAIFTQLTTTGDLAAARFARVTNAADFDNGSTITYVASTGGLYYDINGAAAGGATVFATLRTNLAMTAADFFVT